MASGVGRDFSWLVILRPALFAGRRTHAFPDGHPALQPRLNLPGQSPKIADPLQFVIRQLDVKMIFQPGQKIECLQAVDSQRFEKVDVRRQFLARNFEVRRSECENFFESFFRRFHKQSFYSRIVSGRVPSKSGPLRPRPESFSDRA
jgi:hypothetical protein